MKLHYEFRITLSDKEFIPDKGCKVKRIPKKTSIMYSHFKHCALDMVAGSTSSIYLFL